MDERTPVELTAPPRPPGAVPGTPLPRIETPIVPKNSIGGTALVAVVAIMTFLASLTAGAVTLVAAAASDWQADLARELTVQVKPASGRDIEVDVKLAAEIVRLQPGVAEVRPYTREESARLLEPFLGSGATLDDLPVPRLIVVRLAAGAAPDPAALRKALAKVPTASLDDHRGFVERMRAMAGTAAVGGIAILALVFVATVLSVTFATRGAMATNRPVIEVLHFIGAKDNYIAAHFQRHFLALGLKGGLIGGGAALALFVCVRLASLLFQDAAATAQATALFGSFALGPWGYAAMALQILLIAAVTAVASRRTVDRTLQTIG